MGSQTATPATTYTFTGPSSGNVGSASTNFTVTPVGGVYTGTITLTPSGAGSTGLTPTILTFSNSSTPQTFTITPTVSGSITLTPTNNGTLTNPANLTYTSNATVPGVPTGATATAGNTQATITFTAPVSNGGSVITGYTVTSIPAGGTDTNANTTSLSHIVTGLTNGTSYTFTVHATNAIGNSLESVASNAVVPVGVPGAPANLAATVLGSSVGLSWSAPVSNGGSNITDYIIEYEITTSGTWSIFPDGLNINTMTTVTGLSNNTSWPASTVKIFSAG